MDRDIKKIELANGSTIEFVNSERDKINSINNNVSGKEEDYITATEIEQQYQAWLQRRDSLTDALLQPIVDRCIEILKKKGLLND